MFKCNLTKILFIIFFVILLINEASCKVTVVKAGSDITFSCDRNIFYILIDVSFSGKPSKEYYPFTLTLANPEDLKFKCMLDYPKSKIYCLHSFSSEEDYIEEDTLFRFPIPFPSLEDIKWDYNTFLNEVYRRVYKSKLECGTKTLENLNDIKSADYKAWDIESYLININNGNCQDLQKDNLHRYNFEMSISFKDGDIIDNLNQDEDITLLQEIWVPLTIDEEKSNPNIEEDEFPFALCEPSDKITKTNILHYKLNCYIPIEADSIFDGNVIISSFYDKIYIKQGQNVDIVNIYIQANEDVYINKEEKLIACPNKPIFKIYDKNAIMMGDYYNKSNNYYFYLVGTLSNGYYTFKNGTMSELISVYQDIKFNLIIQDNLEDPEDNDLEVQCVLPSGTLYDEDEEAFIKCTGKREDNSQVNVVDIILNWQLKENNNFDNIIIKWPKSPEGKKKNLYGYKLTGVSMRQSDYCCRDNNFEFYAYIYDLGREPKLTFELPLSEPKDTIASCKVFDKTALKCSINLKHKKLSKGTIVKLPEIGLSNTIDTLEGNKIEFSMRNFTQINNEHDFYVKMKESCGDYLVVGTLKDMGMSHGTSVVTYVLLIVFIFAFVIGSSIYIAWKCGTNYSKEGKLIEDTKSSTNSSVANTSTIKN